MSERRACKIVDLDRSSCRYEAKPNDDHVVIERIKEIVAERPRFGSPRVHLVLRNEGLVRNHKRTERLYYGLGLQLKSANPSAEYISRKIRFLRRSTPTSGGPWTSCTTTLLMVDHFAS